MVAVYHLTATVWQEGDQYVLRCPKRCWPRPPARTLCLPGHDQQQGNRVPECRVTSDIQSKTGNAL